MQIKVKTKDSVFEMALLRLTELYKAGHRMVVTFSGGKDSTVTLELAIMAAEATGNLPVDVVLRDEEILWPGAYDYVERVAERPEVNFRWLVAHQPIINIYNRDAPYWWVFDQTLDPSEWFRPWPKKAEHIPELNIEHIVHPNRFPAAEGKSIFTTIGIRCDESAVRKLGVISMKGHLRSPNELGVRACWPIYDWSDKDVWKAIADMGWDYAKCYDDLARAGVKGNELRVAPPTMSAAGMRCLQIGSKLWPQWFAKLAQRCPGVRSGVAYGRRVLMPRRNVGETWKQTFERECIEKAPKWIADRARAVATKAVERHARHAKTPFQEAQSCMKCGTGTGHGSWRALAVGLYCGDPFSTRSCRGFLPYVDPEFFRPGAGRWGGKPTF